MHLFTGWGGSPCHDGQLQIGRLSCARVYDVLSTVSTDVLPYPRHHCSQDVSGTDDEAEANALLIAGLPDLRRASHALYNEIQAYLIDVADSELPQELVAAFDEMEAAWHKMDGTQPEPAGES